MNELIHLVANSLEEELNHLQTLSDTSMLMEPTSRQIVHDWLDLRHQSLHKLNKELQTFVKQHSHE